MNARRPAARLALAWLFLVLCGTGRAAGWPAADAAFTAGRWDEAILLLSEVAARPGGDALAELRLATAFLHLHRAAEAQLHLERAAALGAPPAAQAYARAALFALSGERDRAFAALDEALPGLGPAARPATDPLLAPLRDDARFAAFLARHERTAAPCRGDPRYRAFDFWLGRWDVRPSGAAPDSPASENVITLEHDGCVVQEHWRSRNGSTGSSFNLYDASRRQWFQTWVDSTGGLHEYRGNPDAQGNMVFEGEVPGEEGQPARVPTRLTFFRVAPDRVRQFSESSVDGGRTWTTNYDLIYVRRPVTATP